MEKRNYLDDCHEMDREINGIAENAEDSFYKDFTQHLVALNLKATTIQDPQEICLMLLEHVMRFYRCDWCGVLKVDMNAGVWKPHLWVSRYGRMTETYFDPLEDITNFHRWELALERHEAIIVKNCGELRDIYPDEYECYARNRAESLLGFPFTQLETGCLIVRNPSRYGDRPEFLQSVWQMTACAMHEKKIMDQQVEKKKWETRNNQSYARVHFFGSPVIETPDGRVTLDQVSVLKIWEIFAYILMKVNAWIDAIKLGEKIMDDDKDRSSKQISRNTRDRIHLMNDAFDQISNRGIPLIELVRNKGYRINPQITLESDFQMFDNYLYKANHASSRISRIEYLKKALDLYKGNFFDDMISVGWIFQEKLKYHRQYFERVDELACLLAEGEDYSNIEHYCTAAVTLEPANVKLYFWIIFALEKMGYYSQSKIVREQTIQNMIEEDDTIFQEEIDKLKSGENISLEWIRNLKA